MYIYREERRFDSKTGKPISPAKVYAGCLCDVCGEAIGDSDFIPEFMVRVDYGCMDDCFGASGEEYSFGEQYGVDMGVFLSDPFTSHNIWNVESTPEQQCDCILGKEIAQSGSLADAIRTLKVRTAKRLIESGIIKSNDLCE